jgi:hypothetical protein
MRREPDTREDTPSMQDAERACEELHDQIERAKKVLREYRNTLGTPLRDNDNRPRG